MTGDLFAVCAVCCLMSLSHAAPLDCKDLTQPLEQLDPLHLEGQWALVAGSMNVIESPKPIELTKSTTIDFYNSTYIKAQLYGGRCLYDSHNVSLEGNGFNFQVGQIYNFSGTFFHTSCADCVVFRFDIESPSYKTMELLLFSKSRGVDQKEMREFITQVECLQMPKHYVMDPTESLCPMPSRRRSSD